MKIKNHFLSEQIYLSNKTRHCFVLVPQFNRRNIYRELKNILNFKCYFLEFSRNPLFCFFRIRKSPERYRLNPCELR